MAHGEAFYAHGLADNDGLLRLSRTQVVSEQLSARIGLDVFHGDARGVFGQYRALDRLFIDLDYSF